MRSNRIEFAQHVLIERIANVVSDPIQGVHATFKLLGKLAKNDEGRLEVVHFRKNHVGASALIRVIVQANATFAMVEALGKQSQDKKTEVPDVLVNVLLIHLIGLIRLLQ